MPGFIALQDLAVIEGRDDAVLTQLCVWVPGIRAPHATCAYSWISPPSRSRRTTLPADRMTGGSTGPSGGACPKARCGRCTL